MENLSSAENLARRLKVYSSGLHNSPLALILWRTCNNNIEITEWNKASEKIFGWTAEEVLGKNFMDFLVPAAEASTVEKIVSLLIEEKYPHNQQTACNTKKTGEVIINWFNTPVIFEDARFIYVISLGEDITEKKSLEKKLQQTNMKLVHQNEEFEALNEEFSAQNDEMRAANDELLELNERIAASEKKFSQLFRQMVDGMALHEIITDKEGNPVDYIFLDVNPAFEKMTGLKKNKIIGKRVMAIFPNTEQVWIERYGRVALSGEPDQFENYSSELDKYYSVTSFCPELRKFAVIVDDITERVKANEKLKQSEEMLNSSQHLAKIGGWRYDIASNELFWTDEVYKIHDMSVKDETAVKKSIECYAGEYRVKIQSAFDALIKSGEEYDIESEFISLKGKKKWVRTVGKPIIENDKIAGAFGNIIDITDKKQAEIALKESEERWQYSLEGSGDGVWDYNSESRKLFVSEIGKELLGFDKRKKFYTLEDWKDIINKDFVDLLENEFSKHLNGQTKQIYCQYKLIDQERWILSRGRVLSRDKKGRPVRIIGTHSDITRQKDTEQEMREETSFSIQLSELSQQVLSPGYSIKSIADMVHALSLKITGSKYGFVASIDPVTEDMVSHTLTDMMNDCQMKDKNIIFPKSGKKYPALWGHALNLKQGFFTNDPVNHETSKGLPKGHVRMENFLSVPALAMGKLVGQIALANTLKGYSSKDLKRIEKVAQVYAFAVLRKHLEDDLVEAREKAEQSDRLKSAFLANMSHEIRTPMNGILGFTALLRDRELPEDKANQYEKIIMNSGKALLSIIDDIIDISKIEAGELKFDIAECNLKEITREIYTSFSHYKDTMEDESRENVLLELSYPLSWDIHVYTDAGRLKQVFNNLLTNAFKFTEKGIIRFGIHEYRPDKITFFTSDTGMGIPEDKFELIFDRFGQVPDQNYSSSRGTGLGLAICKSIIELLGGKIWVESAVGKGSVFYFELPLKKGDAEVLAYSRQEKKTIQNTRWPGKKILIAEDEEINFMFLEELLENSKAEILRAQTGEEAVEYCRKFQVDLVLMDVKMPVMNGFDATRILKKEFPHIPVIAQTAYAFSEDRDKAMEAGCDDYLAKPIRKDNLFRVINKFLGE